ncbi:MAG: hypothetical protein ABI550_06425, partial [Ignavibacteriaceae bacterium]
QNNYEQFGELIRLEIKSASFPHPLREEGNTYNNKLYSKEDHYNDSTVLIFIPKNYRPEKDVDFVIHFHGWFNNVDSVLTQFKLIEQFTASRKNAILIIPQGPKNSPDSFGGKLEDKNGFKNFIIEIINSLNDKEKIKTKNIGNIILSGHSGGYRVIAYILLQGGLSEKIKEVFLFDGLYAELEKYFYWIEHYKGKFINIFTDEGGTKNDSEDFMQDFDAWNFKYYFTEEKNLDEDNLRNNKIIFIHTDLVHNDVIHIRNQFQKFLKASLLNNL